MRLKGLAVILCAVLAIATPAVAQESAGTSIRLNLGNPPVTVAAGSASLVGNPGPRALYYWIVTRSIGGNSAPAGPFVVTNAPVTLSASQYVNISWRPAPGGNFYDVLRTTTPTAPTGACNCAVATGLTAPNYNDQSEALSAYTVNALDLALMAITLRNQATASGTATLQCIQGPTETACNLATGNITTAKLNNIIFVDGITYTLDSAGMEAAAAACIAQGGGTIMPIADVLLTRRFDLGGTGTNKKPCFLDVGYGNGVTITVDVRDGTQGIRLFEGTGIHGRYGFQPFSVSKYSGRIISATTANLDSLIANGDQGGNQQGIHIQGVQIQVPSSGTVNKVVDIVGLHSGTTIRDTFIGGFRGKGLRVACNATAPDQTNNSVQTYDNLVISGDRSVGSAAEPLVVETLNGTCGNADLWFTNQDLEGPGEGKACARVQGSGTQIAMAGATVNSIHFVHGYCEPTTGRNTHGFWFKDAGGVTAKNWKAYAQGTGSSVLVEQTAANYVGYIAVTETIGGGGTNGWNSTGVDGDIQPVPAGRNVWIDRKLNNTSSSSTDGLMQTKVSSLKAETAQIGDVVNGAISGIGGSSTNASGAKVQINGDNAYSGTFSTVGQFHMKPMSGTNGNMVGITFGANNAGAINNQCNGGIFGESNSGFGLRMHLATAAAFGQCIFRMTINYDGHVLPFANNAYDLGIASFQWRTIRAATSVETPTLRLTTQAAPTCSSTTRGYFNYTAGGAGVKDSVQVCAKDAADVYAWRTIY